jgi:hypothetical protein
VCRFIPILLIELAEAEAVAEAYCRNVGSGTAWTHGHIFVLCQDLCFLLLSVILHIDKGGVGPFLYTDWCSLTTPYCT